MAGCVKRSAASPTNPMPTSKWSTWNDARPGGVAPVNCWRRPRVLPQTACGEARLPRRLAGAAGAVPALARVPRALSSSGRFREDRLQGPPGPAQLCAQGYLADTVDQAEQAE